MEDREPLLIPLHTNEGSEDTTAPLAPLNPLSLRDLVARDPLSALRSRVSSVNSDASGRGLQRSEWQVDSEVLACPLCDTGFDLIHRKHHCRCCGRVVCKACSNGKMRIPGHRLR